MQSNSMKTKKISYGIATQVDMTEDLSVQMSGESFLEQLEAGVVANDREYISKLTLISFVRRDSNWQSAARFADNFIIASRDDNTDLQNMCRLAFQQLVSTIKNKKN